MVLTQAEADIPCQKKQTKVKKERYLLLWKTEIHRTALLFQAE